LCTKQISRRKFIKLSFSGIAALALSGFFSKLLFGDKKAATGRRKRNIKADHDIVAASGDDPYKMTVAAVDAIGSIGRFVKKGDVVAIKPNISWDRSPEYAANTNPLVVAALVELCVKAGAKRVNVFDRTCNSAERCYNSSGVKEAAEEKGGRVYFVDTWNMVDAVFDYRSPMEGWPIFRDAVECDTFINVPVLKHHGLTGLTLSMKNLMGVCGGNRGLIHRDIGKRLVDLTDFIKPDLTVIDAFRVLTRNGPSGGSLEDVVNMKKVIAAVDPTLADTYACTIFGKDPMSIPYIAEAAGRNFGSHEVDKADLLELSV